MFFFFLKFLAALGLAAACCLAVAPQARHCGGFGARLVQGEGSVVVGHGLACPVPWDLPRSRDEPCVLCTGQANSNLLEHQGSPRITQFFSLPLEAFPQLCGPQSGGGQCSLSIPEMDNVTPDPDAGHGKFRHLTAAWELTARGS